MVKSAKPTYSYLVPLEEEPKLGIRGGVTPKRLVKTGEFKGEVFSNLSVAVPEPLLLKAKIWCLWNKTSITAIVNEAIKTKIGH
jgi:hypothetical protein